MVPPQPALQHFGAKPPRVYDRRHCGVWPRHQGPMVCGSRDHGQAARHGIHPARSGLAYV